jgi:hypothetical protein
MKNIVITVMNVVKETPVWISPMYSPMSSFFGMTLLGPAGI